MNATVNKKTLSRVKKRRLQRSAKTSGRDKREIQFLSFTIDPDTAHVVRFETLDAHGGRRELSEKEKATLIRNRSEGQLEDVLERVFEAGLGCVLNEEVGESKSDDGEEDAELRHLLLTQLIQHSPARHLMHREALSRVVLGALIRDSVQAAPMAASGSEARTQARRTSPARAKSHRGQTHDRHHN